MWRSTKCPNLWLTESEPRDVAHTSFIENLGGVHMHSGCAGTDPIARWKSDGHPGGCHLQYVTWRVEQHSTGNQISYYHPLNQWLLGVTNGNQGHTVMHLCAPPHKILIG